MSRLLHRSRPPRLLLHRLAGRPGHCVRGGFVDYGAGESRVPHGGPARIHGRPVTGRFTVVGAVVCSGDESRALRLANVDVFGSPKGTDFEFNLGWGWPTSYLVQEDPTIGGGNVTVRLKQLPDTSAPTGMRPALPADFVGRYSATNPDAPLLRENDFEVMPADGSVTTLAAAGVSFNNGDLQGKLVENLNSATVNATNASSNSAFSQGKLSLDLNKFLRVGDTLQVVYRRIH